MVMDATRERHRLRIAGSDVVVVGRTGETEPTWTLLVDGMEVDAAKQSGKFTLRGTLPDGSEVEAEVQQGLLGPTGIVVRHAGEFVAEFEGFVA